ncbi:MAG: hypothetical protein IKJ99_03325 [Oscillospiraceae bacterium]|nr:hypothetical protein [Oscillospiraceae bacterium]
MLTVFKVMMLLFVAISFLGSLAEANDSRRKMYFVLFGVCGVLFLLAEATTHFL